ncbi:MAG: SMP-30/gluconolactonase/LRE family protein [Pseudomonadota bacterium]|nr:SMP-30/gluconolactonase/LRE family protein [Pseudomonadota bacterium]MEC8089611.1 SMP-30/gluconolactonase/LRE family protein [Pseudomonadota bacterium]
MEPICIVPAGDVCGEAATWDAAANRLYWTDINRFLLHAHDPAAGTMRTHMFDQPVVALSLTNRQGRLLVALGSRLILFNPADGSREDLPAALEGWPELRFNDGRSDPRGTFWIGSMGNNVGPNGEGLPVTDGKGTLYRYQNGGALETIETGIGIPNTLCWSPDGRRFYFGDSLKNEIRVYGYDPESGDIGSGASFFSGFERGVPDGSAMDSEGFLWNCRYGGGCVVRVAPDGTIDRVIEMPAENITTCTFGGADLTTLYITTAAADRAPEDRLAGSLFAIETGVRGMPENVFNLG